MNFIKNSADKNPIVDTVFTIVRKAVAAKEQHGAENVTDATLGSLYSEDGNLVAMESVFKSFDEVTPKQKAGYASGFMGNPDFRSLCTEWVLEDANLCSSVVATPGGTGAVSLGIGEFLETGETVLVPDIAWTSYAIMAKDKQLGCVQYNMFDKNDNFNLESIKTQVNALKGKCPIFGSGLGHEVIALSYGGKISKLKFGHRGVNHPVKNLLNGIVEVTSQNHGYVVDADSLKTTKLEIVQLNIIDLTVEGMRCTDDKVFGIQYQTESALNSLDSECLFCQF